MSTLTHTSVLTNEVISLIRPKDGGIYVDGTVGGGGHTEALLEASSPTGRVIGFEIDITAIKQAQKRLSSYAKRLTLIHESFSVMPKQLIKLGTPEVDGVILDLGMSSLQLDDIKRGFSFQKKGPLDMRMDTSQKSSAWHIVNTLPEPELAKIIREYGEEKNAKNIAKAICESRRNKPIDDTLTLAELIAKTVPRGKRRHHPATKTFQALRIAVNNELNHLKQLLDHTPDFLKKGGRLAIISFHSLEDRLVKLRFRELSKTCTCPPGLPVCGCGHKRMAKDINKKAIKPSKAECIKNPRARSARLRVIERL